MKAYVKYCLGLCMSLAALLSVAQSVREQDIVYRKNIVREISLKDPLNTRFFGKKALMSTILLEATFSGQYKAYHPDSIHKELKPADITSRLSYPSESGSVETYSTEQLYLVELSEELIFDKNKSEFRCIATYITVFIPAYIHYKGIMEPVASWKFEDCQKIFRSDPRAYSEILQLGQPALNYNEIFALGAYNSVIVKIGSKDDLYFDQMYNDPYSVFIARMEEENRIREMMYKTLNPE